MITIKILIGTFNINHISHTPFTSVQCIELKVLI